MSRRRGEFEHRTSIFEGAFRAWSHLGGLEPHDLETKPANELDPLAHPIENDPRLAAQKEKDRRKSNKSENEEDNEDDKPQHSGREYPYEPLPRSGLVHPFVQAILSPWLGPDADQDAIQLGLTTLRTWWQHRRKGESGSAIVALGTEKMQGVVEGYTRHFFNLAHCLVVNDKEQPPRTLHAKMRELEKANAKKGKKRGREDENDQVMKAAMAFQGGYAGNSANINVNLNMTPTLNDGGGGGGGLLDRLQASQRRLLAAEGGVSSLMPNNNGLPNLPKNNIPQLEMKGRCVPGKVDLPGLVQKVNAAATQLAHRGLANAQVPAFTPNVDPSKFGDPNVMPVILISQNGDIQFLMTVDGITCAHCVKIVETVLKGPPGKNTASPIDGLLDAAADQELNAIVIKIASISEARRIAHEASRNLTMVGYTATTKSINIQSVTKNSEDNGEEMTLQKMYKAFEIVPNINPMVGNVIMWGTECKCPDNNVMRMNCPRHQQMSHRIFEAFDQAHNLVSEIVAGCGKKYGMPCTAGAHCFCKSSDGVNDEPQTTQQLNDLPQDPMQAHQTSLSGVEDQPLKDGTGRSRQMSMRMSLSGLLGRHSLTSNTTFGRAMSGLSALSIDWENMDDFDINVDHSEGINNDIVNQQKAQQEDKAAATEEQLKTDEEGYDQMEMNNGPIQRVGPRTARRSSLRNPNLPVNNPNANNVSFDM